MLVWAMLDCFDQQRSRVTDLDGVIKCYLPAGLPEEASCRPGRRGGRVEVSFSAGFEVSLSAPQCGGRSGWNEVQVRKGIGMRGYTR